MGLEPFEAAHAAYFFGRRQDAKVLADHVVARSITVLYGPSGIGKTSLLNVGLQAALPQGTSWTIVKLRDWQDPGQLERLAVNALLDQLPVKPIRSSDRIRFAPLVAFAFRSTRRPIILVLDQFEEYFRYRDPGRMRDTEIAIGTLVARRDLPIHVLVALRDDALYELDQLRAFIPGILDTTIGLGHLRDSDVEEAIRRPIERYNEVYRRGSSDIVLDDSLVVTLIKQLKEAHVGLGMGGAAIPSERRVELPYLQLALMKLWVAEGGPAATALRETTLTDAGKLGGVRQIVRDHVSAVMHRLPTEEQELCAKMFDRLVTDIGSKIAYPTQALASREIVGPGVNQKRVEAVLSKLTPKDARILKPVIANGLPAFELFHDVLGLPVLEWKRSFQAGGRNARIWVLWSTRETIANEIPSVTAIVETVLAVTLYWWVAIHFHTYLPLLISVAVAPLVLLKSDQSVILGAKWFTLVSGKLHRPSSSGSLERNEMSVTTSIGAFILLPLVALAIRFAATLTHIFAGVQNLPRNFRRLILCTSPNQPPELLPGLGADETNFILGGLSHFHPHHRTGLSVINKTLLVYPLWILLWFVPSYLYRLSIKSTAWLWWLLVFLVGDWRRSIDPYEFHRKFVSSLWAKVNITLSVTMLAIFLLTNVFVNSATLLGGPLSYLLIFFVLQSPVRFESLLLFSWAPLNIVLVFMSDEIALKFNHATKSNNTALRERVNRELGFLDRLARLRTLLALTLWLFVGVHTILYLNAAKCWFTLPANVEQWATWIYGAKYPAAACFR